MATAEEKEKALKLAAMRGVISQKALSKQSSGTAEEIDVTAALAKKNIFLEGNVLEILEKDPLAAVHIEIQADGKIIITPPHNSANAANK